MGPACTGEGEVVFNASLPLIIDVAWVREEGVRAGGG
jgi:hypothetical protein